MYFRSHNVDKVRLQQLLAFQKILGFKFRDVDLLNRALTHRSYVNEDPASPGNNERLEFLGDAVLGMVTASRLFTTLEDKAEGDLARIKSFVVSEEALSGMARSLGVDGMLLVGKGEERSGGRNKKALLADALEAIFGAAFLDGGFEKARDLVLSLVTPEINKVLSDTHRKDYKTLLQEYAQKWHKTCPAYTMDRKTGPDHDRTYWMNCVLMGVTYGPEPGKTKKDAEQAAAALAYDAIIAAGGAEADLLQSVKKL
ncbi:MAG: ribonuclease III [Clostridia bacterium]